MILGNLCRGRRIQISGHFDFGNFNNVGASSILTCVWADTASAACPAHLGSLDIASITFAAVICDSDDPCSVNTAYDPESSFTMSRRSITLHSYFWNCGSNSEFLRWQRSINDAKCTVLPLFLASAITTFLFLTFVTCLTSIFSPFFTLFYHSCLCTWNSHCFRHRNKLVHKIEMSYGIRPFCSDVILMRCVSSSF